MDSQAQRNAAAAALNIAAQGGSYASPLGGGIQVNPGGSTVVFSPKGQGTSYGGSSGGGYANVQQQSSSLSSSAATTPTITSQTSAIQQIVGTGSSQAAQLQAQIQAQQSLMASQAGAASAAEQAYIASLSPYQQQAIQKEKDIYDKLGIKQPTISENLSFYPTKTNLTPDQAAYYNKVQMGEIKPSTAKIDNPFKQQPISISGSTFTKGGQMFSGKVNVPPPIPIPPTVISASSPGKRFVQEVKSLGPISGTLSFLGKEVGGAIQRATQKAEAREIRSQGFVSSPRRADSFGKFTSLATETAPYFTPVGPALMIGQGVEGFTNLPGQKVRRIETSIAAQETLGVSPQVGDILGYVPPAANVLLGGLGLKGQVKGIETNRLNAAIQKQYDALSNAEPIFIQPVKGEKFNIIGKREAPNIKQTFAGVGITNNELSSGPIVSTTVGKVTYKNIFNKPVTRGFVGIDISAAGAKTLPKSVKGLGNVQYGIVKTGEYPLFSTFATFKKGESLAKVSTRLSKGLSKAEGFRGGFTESLSQKTPIEELTKIRTPEARGIEIKIPTEEKSNILIPANIKKTPLSKTFSNENLLQIQKPILTPIKKPIIPIPKAKAPLIESNYPTYLGGSMPSSLLAETTIPSASIVEIPTVTRTPRTGLSLTADTVFSPSVPTTTTIPRTTQTTIQRETQLSVQPQRETQLSVQPQRETQLSVQPQRETQLSVQPQREMQRLNFSQTIMQPQRELQREEQASQQRQLQLQRQTQEQKQPISLKDSLFNPEILREEERLKIPPLIPSISTSSLFKKIRKKVELYTGSTIRKGREVEVIKSPNPLIAKRVTEEFARRTLARSVLVKGPKGEQIQLKPSPGFRPSKSRRFAIVQINPLEAKSEVKEIQSYKRLVPKKLTTNKRRIRKVRL